MTNETPKYRRRPLLKGTATAGVGSFAGCSMLSDPEEERTATTHSRQSETTTQPQKT